jgi:SAM-dependent methyltransferase
MIKSSARFSIRAVAPANTPCSLPHGVCCRRLRLPGGAHRCGAAQGRRAQPLIVKFLVKDALKLHEWTERFDNVLDSGLFHVFSDEDRIRYVRGLKTVLDPGGRLFLLCFSDATPGTEGPRRVSQPELRVAGELLSRRPPQGI